MPFTLLVLAYFTLKRGRDAHSPSWQSQEPQPVPPAPSPGLTQAGEGGRKEARCAPAPGEPGGEGARALQERGRRECAHESRKGPSLPTGRALRNDQQRSWRQGKVVTIVTRRCTSSTAVERPGPPEMQGRPVSAGHGGGAETPSQDFRGCTARLEQ